MTSHPKPSVADIRRGYDEPKRAFDRMFVTSPFFRALSFYPTVLLVRLGWSASQATWMSLVVGLIGCGMMALGTHGWMVVGSVFVALWFIADYVDGNMARYLEQASSYGRFLDDFVGELIEVGVFLSLGMGLYATPGHALGGLFDPGVYLLAGAVAALAKVLTASFNAKYREIFSSGSGPPGEPVGPGRVSPVTFFIRNVMSFAGLVIPALLVAAALDAADVFLLFYANAYALLLVFTLATLVRKARSLPAGP